jgi:tricarballylate dehydrogenase
MLEKAPEIESGGNARYSGTGFRFCHRGVNDIRDFLPGYDEAALRRMHMPPYSVDDFVSDLNQVTDGHIDQQLARVLAEESFAAVCWLRRLGIQWELSDHVVIDGQIYFEPGLILHPLGGGLGQLRTWRSIAERNGIEIRFESAVRALHGNYREVTGVRVSGPEGEYDIAARSVILCSGGFQANREMRARYLGAHADLMKVRGNRHNTGEVLRMALELGARAAGEWQGAHITPIDAGAPDFEVRMRGDGVGNSANRYNYPFGITVNRLGVRFFDEGESFASYTYAKTGKELLRQPGGIAFQIYDAKGGRVLPPHAEQHLEEMIEAPTIEALAQKIGANPEVLAATVRDFNAAIRDDRPFDHSTLDGRHTVGIFPPKSNWAISIEEPPFRAYRVTGGITFTFGGVEVTPEAQVVAMTGRPIAGLYASGDILGIFFHNYPSCSGQTRNAVFSYRAGRHAAAQIGS